MTDLATIKLTHLISVGYLLECNALLKEEGIFFYQAQDSDPASQGIGSSEREFAINLPGRTKKASGLLQSLAPLRDVLRKLCETIRWAASSAGEWGALINYSCSYEITMIVVTFLHETAQRKGRIYNENHMEE